MLKGYQIMDADGHVVEPTGMWEKYLEPEFKARAPRKEEIPGGKTTFGRVKVDGVEIFTKISDDMLADFERLTNKYYGEYVAMGFNPESQVKAMKKLGVDVAFLYPTFGLNVTSIDTMDPKLAGALTRAYNNWLHDFCNYDTKVLRGVGAINRHDPEEMVPELRRVAEFGWKGVFLRPNPIKGRLLSDPAYEPFWTECERLGISVGLHEGTHCRLPATGADRFHTRFALHACSHPLEQMMAMLALIEGGVLERHPNLKVAFLEAGCGWLPYWLWRLDELEYRNLAWEVKDNVKMKPSEYFRRQCFIACEPDEPYIHDIIKYIGEDNLIFASDYPHADHQPDIVEEVVELEERLPKKTVQKILWENPVRFYGLS